MDNTNCTDHLNGPIRAFMAAFLKAPISDTFLNKERYARGADKLAAMIGDVDLPNAQGFSGMHWYGLDRDHPL